MSMRTRRHTIEIPMDGDVLTQGALDGLVGQEVIVTQGFDQQHLLGKAEVVGAEFRDGSLHLTLAWDDGTEARVHAIYSEHTLAYGGIGFQVEDSERRDDGVRAFKAIRLREVSPRRWPPAMPRFAPNDVS